MRQQATVRTADNKGLATIGMSLAAATVFAAMVAAAVVTSEVQATSATADQVPLANSQR